MKFSIVGYGSLLSHKSLRKTFSNKQFHPVVVKGYKRIFNVRDYQLKNPDVLNLKKSRNSFFNGVLFEISALELNKLRKREGIYNIEETKCYDFKTKKSLGNCLICIDYHKAIDHHHNNPNKSYFILCREAAYHINKEFGKTWDETTFTSSNEKISKWIKKHQEYDTVKSTRVS